MNILISKNRIITDLIKFERKIKCNVRLYNNKKTKCAGDNKKYNNFLKNICNKNVIRNLDSVNIIENLKYVTEYNVNEDIIKNYINRVKTLKEQWGLNKIYFIFKTLIKYKLYDAALLSRLENIINDIEVPNEDMKKEKIDCFENVYIIRISYILYSFHYFNHTNEQLVNKLINILNIKIGYIIYHNDYFNRFIFNTFKDFNEKYENIKQENNDSSGKDIDTVQKSINDDNKKCNESHGYGILGNSFKFNGLKKEIYEIKELTLDSNKHVDVYIRNVTFNEIYFIISLLKKINYTSNKQFLNKLKLIYYFNCIDIENPTENDCKYITLLFHLIYEPGDKYLYNIMKLFLLRHNNVSNIHDLVLIMMTIYYTGVNNSKSSNANNIDCFKEDINNISHQYESAHSRLFDDIDIIIDQMHTVSKEKTKKLKFILNYISEHRNDITNKDIPDIICERIFNLLNYEYYKSKSFCYDFESKNKEKRISENIENEQNEENNLEKNRPRSYSSDFYKTKSSDLQSISEFIKICNYMSKDVDALYYLYLKNNIEFFNMETIINVMKMYVFVYNINNDLNKNYHKNKHKDLIYSNMILDNLNNLTNIIVQIIIMNSLHRLYSSCSLKNLANILYYLQQINSTFDNKIFEELHIKKLQNHIDDIVTKKLKVIINKQGENNINVVKELQTTKERYHMNNLHAISFDDMETGEKINENITRKTYQNEDDNMNYENLHNSLSKKSENINERNNMNLKIQHDENNINTFISLFNIYSKNLNNKKIIYMLLQILNKYNIENKPEKPEIYINLLNSFAKMKYRNLLLIETCLKKVTENLNGLHFFDCINLLISLSRLNIFGINLNVYDDVPLSLKNKDAILNIKTPYENEKLLFINECNDNNLKNCNQISMVNNLKSILKKINENLSNFIFTPSYKIINIIPNILNSYIILGFDKIHFKNINKMLESFHHYIFNYFEEKYSENINMSYYNNKYDIDNFNEYCSTDISNSMGSPSVKNHYWYFSEQNNVILTKKNSNISLHIPIHSIYQLYIFNVYFNIYIKYLYQYYINEDVSMPVETHSMNNNEAINCIKNQLHYLNNSRIYINDDKTKTNKKKSYDFFKIHNILSEKSIHILNNIIYFVKYINNFYNKSTYEKYNFYMQFLIHAPEKETKNEQLVEYAKECHIIDKRNNSSIHSSSFHRDVFSTFRLLGINDMECEVPFLDGIYTVDIVIQNSICVEINGNNHYYYDRNMKRSCQNIDCLNLIKYYLLCKKYKLILIPYLEWNKLKNNEEKKEYLKNKMES
ncbi:RAP protein, putative [Plasmodium chabaudi adami]|uniref:RAP protein, putative n=1 Tax=Plasmodium chabaudi adami TaxID=5826 RepID=A0A1C6YHI7_PLACE|nr:RAP protein, putative [Plasmodium chabaudi adami]